MSDSLSINAVAVRLKMSVATVRRMVRDGEFAQPDETRGSNGLKAYWKPETVERWLNPPPVKLDADELLRGWLGRLRPEPFQSLREREREAYRLTVDEAFEMAVDVEDFKRAMREFIDGRRSEGSKMIVGKLAAEKLG